MINLLLIEDNEIDCFIAEKLINFLNIPVNFYSCRNGEEALKMIMTQYQENLFLPDIILVDMHMPIMDGKMFLTAFANLSMPLKERIRVIMLSNNVNPVLFTECYALGVYQFLMKPLTREALTLLVRDLRPLAVENIPRVS